MRILERTMEAIATAIEALGSVGPTDDAALEAYWRSEGPPRRQVERTLDDEHMR
jgi:hypothetical protein